MASKNDMTEILGILLIVVIALGLTPTIAASSTDARYGLSFSELDKVTGTAQKVTVTLTYGNIRNESGYITITLNVTDKNSKTTETYETDYIVKTLGDYSTGATIEFGTAQLNDTVKYGVTTEYSYLLPAAQAALLSLLPMFWVILIIAAVVAVVTKKMKMW